MIFFAKSNLLQIFLEIAKFVLAVKYEKWMIAFETNDSHPNFDDTLKGFPLGLVLLAIYCTKASFFTKL